MMESTIFLITVHNNFGFTAGSGLKEVRFAF